MDKEQILRALENLGMDVQTERFKTEIYHLTTLFEQGQTVTEVLHTVSDVHLRTQLKPVLYYVTLRALVLALATLQMITLEQASDFARFLGESTGIPTHKDSVGNGP
ncbi:MAG: hypothetical protein ACRDHZ_07755 [Ktedonobacteraceae bacterium]